MGAAYGVTGVAMGLSNGDGDFEKGDDYTSRMASGCAAGLTLGLASISSIWIAPFNQY